MVAVGRTHDRPGDRSRPDNVLMSQATNRWRKSPPVVLIWISM
jgi:hypothetical protein